MAQDLRSQVGQLLIMGFDGTAPSHSLEKLMFDLRPAGVILFAANLESPTQCHDLLAFCRSKAEVPLFTCIDLEGGTVDRFRKIIGPAPPPHDVARTGDRKLFEAFGRLLGAESRKLGFNVDFAPVSDLGFERSRSVLGSRTVSADPKATIVFVREFLRGLKSERVLGCGKHFPGLGEADLDSHHLLPVIEKPWQRMWAEDLAPYRALHRQYPFVMVAHAAYPQVTNGRTPASLSRTWIADVLRTKVGYRGLIISDDLDMGAVLATGPIEEAAVGCIRAGADMFLVCHKEDQIRRAHEAVMREAERDRTFAEQVRQASRRVVRFKTGAPELKRAAPRPTEKTVAGLRRALERFHLRLRKALGE
jgi:beta-N-acetylhexosaminidase